MLKTLCVRAEWLLMAPPTGICAFVVGNLTVYGDACPKQGCHRGMVESVRQLKLRREGASVAVIMPIKYADVLVFKRRWPVDRGDLCRRSFSSRSFRCCSLL